MEHYFRVVLAIGLVLLLLTIPTMAQGGSAAFSGKVVDVNGHAVAGVDVQVTNLDTNRSYPTTTNDAGMYRVSVLPPGSYRIVVTKQNFAHLQRTAALHAGDKISIDFELRANGNSAERRGRKNVLAWIDTRSGTQSHGAAVIERLGYESGLWDTYIRTDSESFNDLKDFDAIFFLGANLESDVSAHRRTDLLSFVKDDGKGFVAGHNAADMYHSWKEYGEMLGGRLEQPQAHPWGFIDETLVIEDPHFPGMQGLPRMATWYTETYQIKDVSRDKVDVLMRLDASKLDLTKANNKAGDFPQAWAKMYGKGRVYYNTLGHDVTEWDNPAIQKMYFEAIKWALRLTDAKIEPHPLVRVNGTPQPLK